MNTYEKAVRAGNTVYFQDLANGDRKKALKTFNHAEVDHSDKKLYVPEEILKAFAGDTNFEAVKSFLSGVGDGLGRLFSVSYGDGKDAERQKSGWGVQSRNTGNVNPSDQDINELEGALESYDTKRKIGNAAQAVGYTGAAVSASMDFLEGLGISSAVGLAGAGLSSKYQENLDTIQQEGIIGLNKAYGNYEIVPK
jgi:hypothetical protein